MSPLDSSRILVTGATGLLGNNLVRALLERGVSVRALLRESSDPRRLAGLDVEIWRGDLLQPETIAPACQGAGLILHAAAEVRIGCSQPDRLHRINVGGTRTLSALARASGARLVYVSSSDTARGGTRDHPATEDAAFDPRFATPYSISKLEAEQAVLAQVARGLDAVMVRPSFMLGPWDWKPSSGALLLAVARGLAPLAPRGETSLVDVRDVAAAILAAATRGRRGQVYLLAGTTLSNREAFSLFAKVSGSRAPLGELGPVSTGALNLATALASTVLGREPRCNATALRAARMPRGYCSDLARRELGFTTRPAAETVADAWQWFLREGYATPPRSRK